MTRNIPEYIVARLQRELPDDTPIISGSTPVLSFGDVTKATIATLGLNPSRVEFLDRDGFNLEGGQRRLESLATLNVPSLIDAPPHVLQAVVDGCNGYFQKQPYRRWFDQLEIVLKECGASYYDGSACHLDLVQWATDPTWSKLWDGVRTVLLQSDVPFLMHQLQTANIKALLLNGRAVVREFAAAAEIDLVPQPYKIMGKTTMFVGRGPRDIQVIGWSTNLQSSHGVSNVLRTEVGKAAHLLQADAEITTEKPV